ncbi:uncharacterized protein EI90DRAFT_3155180 [Cantharellus anzutake]|uniref:uncharacterized protein n=1 Tax=Cantharellus anzutake TaxID=1750568 RepID=UPI001907FDFD|nr:uncharacterized protein EI90DRAFT_3155180 [Cantharellus anzutake]KAF8329752.1 hypothetical protein EI90DRAFT_3155180 [Cantharellus anzutake]
MFSWLQSTISNALPSVPLNLQQRFFSFVLKRALGRFVHPDQLDAFQIDAQIGNGQIEISNVHLATDTINEAIRDLPFQLRNGFVGRITVNIPWSNIWSAPITVSLDTLNTTFSLPRAADPSALKPGSLDRNLSQSVSNLAESFVLQELGQEDTLKLRESIAPNAGNATQTGAFRVPGGLDPFMMAGGDAEDDAEDGDEEGDFQGASVFASLTEWLINRLKISVLNAHVSIIDERCKIAVFIPDFSYGPIGPACDDSLPSCTGQERVLRVNGLSITMKDLAPHPVQSMSNVSVREDSLFTSDGSDDDDAARTMLSQSVASLPPPPSVYQSALSLPLGPDTCDSAESTMLSMTELLITVEPVSSPSRDPIPAGVESQASRVQGQTQSPSLGSNNQWISINVQLGTVACAFQRYQLNSLLSISHRFSRQDVPTHTSKSSKSSPPPSPSKFLELSLRLKSFVSVFLLDLEQCEATSSNPSGGHFPINIHLSTFFQKPYRNIPFFQQLRVQADDLEAVSALDRSQYTSRDRNGRLPLRGHLADFYMALISPRESGNALTDCQMDCIASPIILFDPNLTPVPGALTSHYLPRDSSALVQRMFPVGDITSDSQWDKHQGAHFKPSAWRKSRLPPKMTHNAPAIDSSTTKSMVFHETIEGDIFTVSVSLLPLHLFVDLDTLMQTMPFVDGIFQGLSDDNLEAYSDPDSDDESPILDIDQGQDANSEEFPFDTPRPRQLDLPLVDPVSPSSSSGTLISIKMVRVELRTPPTVIRGQVLPRRSGALTFDICGISAVTGGSQSGQECGQRGQKRAVFMVPSIDRQPEFEPNLSIVHGAESCPLLRIEWELICLAFAKPPENTAIGVLSIGPLSPPSSSHPSETRLNDLDKPFLPYVSASQSTILTEGNSRSLVNVAAALPSIRLSLGKPQLDLVQLWADDVAQWIERFAESRTAEARTREIFYSHNTSLIGSRFFSRRPKSLSSSFTTTSGANTASSLRNPVNSTEVCIKCSVTEGSIQLWIPRSDASGSSGLPSKPVNLDVFEVDAMLTSKPSGKDEMIIQLSIIDVHIFDTGANDEATALLYLTTQRLPGVDLVPMVKIRFASVNMSDKAAKESRIKISLWGSTYQLLGQGSWFDDIGRYARAPEGAFESVVPSERTVFSVHVEDFSVKLLAPLHPGSIVLAFNNAHVSADLVGKSPESRFKTEITSAWLFCIDTLSSSHAVRRGSRPGKLLQASDYWKRTGFAPLVELNELVADIRRNVDPDQVANKVLISDMNLLIGICADSLSSASSFISDFSNGVSPPDEEPRIIPRAPPMVSRGGSSDLLASLDEHAFRDLSELGEMADMINDDLPSNADYLDTSFGAAAGVRDIVDEDLDDVEDEQSFHDDAQTQDAPDSIVSTFGGETIRIFEPNGLRPVENYFDSLVPEDLTVSHEELRTVIRAENCNITLSLHSGFDWHRTRRIVDDEVRTMRRKLLKIRHLVAAGGQVPDDSIEETHALLFNSVYIGIRPEVNINEPNALMEAIDEELQDDFDDTATQSSWQSLHREPMASNAVAEENPGDSRNPNLKRSRHPSVQLCFAGAKIEYDGYGARSDTASRLLLMSKDVEILDHIKSSTWRKFLTQMREDLKGNVRETGSDMLRIELLSVRPVRGNPSEEARLKAKILPLRLHVDQDALDFIKKFFAFKDPDAPQAPEELESDSSEIYFQHVDVFPVEIKLDYKPKRVDYRALKEGRTLELMNFFHFDGSEMTLRHIEMFGVTGWARMFDMLNDLWSPDVKANQLADVISGIEPIRSVVNVGSGVADLVLLPIEQYKKDGRIIRGLQKGTTSFVKSTAMEAIRLGARLANGTQIILEHAENVLGGRAVGAGGAGDVSMYSTAGGGYEEGWTRAELHGVVEDSWSDEEELEDLLVSGRTPPEVVSRYANQPRDVREGLQSAYVSLGKNLQSAAQTILAVPMEVYERSGSGAEGPVRAVVRAVPIAVLKPMIGASEAVSKTLLGLRNSLDPGAKRDIDEKYKKI